MMMMMRAPMIQVPWYYCHHHLIFGKFTLLDNQGAWEESFLSVYFRLWSLLLSSDWSNLLSECSLASPGSPCTNLEAEDCKYEYIHGDYCCCGQCHDPQWLSLDCVLNPTTGDKLWHPIDSICPADGCGSEGECWKGKCQNVFFLSQVLSPRQTTPTTIQTTFKGQRQYKLGRDWSCP